MAVSFPPSPSQGDVYTYNGTTYTFDGVKWVSGGATVFLQKAGDTMTGDLTPAATGQSGYLSRAGTTLSPATAGDDVDLGTGDLSAAAGTFSGNVDIGTEDPTFGHQIELNPSGTSWIGDYSANCIAVTPDAGKTKCTVNYVGTPTDGDPNDWSFRVAQFDGAFNLVAPRFLVGADGSTYIGGTLPASPNITLNADGSAAIRSTTVPPNSGTSSSLLLTNGQAPGSGYFLQCYSSLNPDQAVGAGTHAAQLDTNGTLSLLNPTVGSLASERRLKENISPIDAVKAWETVKSVPYYSYNFISNDPSNVVYGPMADEVPDDMRIATDRTDDVGVIHTYDNGMLQARLYTALQTALTRIEALEAEVQVLKGQSAP